MKTHNLTFQTCIPPYPLVVSIKLDNYLFLYYMLIVLKFILQIITVVFMYMTAGECSLNYYYSCVPFLIKEVVKDEIKTIF
jgi:hypothetical protein